MGTRPRPHMQSPSTEAFTLSPNTDSNSNSLTSRYAPPSFPKKAAILDHELTRNETLVAKNTLLTHMDKYCWTEPMTRMFIDSRSYRTPKVNSQPQRGKVSLVYKAEACKSGTES
ncbi:hypothetical protein Agabi119p4_3479 [Agaricus bisporus var. burnettii]|uniref:Uncharacterized protein n=1 Tax=Agaricus bisporus var. burnettii TaxID=192524 RepID=A0A8H7F7B0_AGABI|nr:hypothetical protein Agabi119p4_3479 [Agaricus bisporus var. burnettii]